jgi:hypothetical protein
LGGCLPADGGRRSGRRDLRAAPERADVDDDLTRAPAGREAERWPDLDRGVWDAEAVASIQKAGGARTRCGPRARSAGLWWTSRLGPIGCAIRSAWFLT